MAAKKATTNTNKGLEKETKKNENPIENKETLKVEEEKVIEEKVIEVEPLVGTDEIKVESLIPHVSYEDKTTKDMYTWEETGDIEMMTFDAIKVMWRNYKSYFRDMWLRPLDERVVEELRLTKTYEKYDLLMNSKNYISENIEEICSTFSSLPNGLKFTVCNKIKDMISTKELSDIFVIRRLEKFLDTDLVSLA